MEIIIVIDIKGWFNMWSSKCKTFDYEEHGEEMTIN